jgi:hypothetical protein
MPPCLPCSWCSSDVNSNSFKVGGYPFAHTLEITVSTSIFTFGSSALSISLAASSMARSRTPATYDAFLDEMEFTVGQLKSLVEWLARQARIPPETGTVDGSVIPPEEQLLEIVHTEARYEVVRLEGAAEEVQAQVLKKRRERVLLDQADLQTISRYEAYLSRQMYQALHELEALQSRRGGKATPLARLDVQS